MKHLFWIVLCSSLVASCSSDEALNTEADQKRSGEGTNSINNGGGPGASPNDGDGFVAEREENFELADPTVIDDEVWIANSTLNSVAVINGTSLAIRSIPVGFRPADIVGPATAEAGSVMVLNEGSSSVSIIDPSSDEVDNVRVIAHANRLEGAPDAGAAVAWYDARESSSTLTDLGDVLSSVSLVKADGGAFRIAVGFNVRDVAFSADGTRALVLSDDGVSALDVASIDSDAIAAPQSLSLLGQRPEDVEMAVDADARYVLARAAGAESLTMLDVAAGVEHVVPLPEIPTDLDVVSTSTGATAFVVLRNTGSVLAFDLPDGVVAAEQAWAGLEPDMGADAGPDAGADVGVDADDADAMVDAGADSGDADAASADAGPDAGAPLPPASGVAMYQMPSASLGSAVVSADASVALVFGTISDLREAVLLTLATGETRTLFLDKGVRGALAEPGGRAFVIFHDREPGGVPAGANPTDSEFIERSWGVTLVDTATATTRLLLTESEPGPTALYADDTTRKLYIGFVAPEGAVLPSARDVTEVDLDTFAVDAFRVPDLPESLGSIPSAGKAFVSQRHPTGRMTFIDVATAARHTVTGFQLNAGID